MPALTRRLLLISPLIASLLPSMNALSTCIPRRYSSASSIVCVCNATHCDEFPPLGEEIFDSSQAILYTSSMEGKRFERAVLQWTNKTETPTPHKNDVRISINASLRYQNIIGFGGAFTDAAGINFNSLSEATRERLLGAYYGPEGIEYTLGRVPMAGCDFSTRVYSYDDVDGDFLLANFSLTEEDCQLKIPHIKRAQEMSGGRLKLFASPWSAPGWMKATGKMVGGGALKGDFNGKYYETWANYYIRFFEEYDKAGVNFWALTVQNEPSTGAVPGWKWPTQYYSPKMQRDFVKVHLGPALKNNSITASLKLIVHDDQRFWLPGHANKILADADASRYIDGIGVHWYTDFLFSAKRLTETHNAHPDKFILPTEACSGYVPFINGPKLGSWARAEDYGWDIIEDLENWAVGWTDWNLCLDEQGGPNFAGNYVDSPIIVNATADEFYKQPMYYVLGHFAKFIRPGSIRLGISIITQYKYFDPRVGGTAYWDDGNKRYVLVVQNRHNSHTYNVTVVHPEDDLRVINFPLGSRSIVTMVWK